MCSTMTRAMSSITVIDQDPPDDAQAATSQWKFLATKLVPYVPPLILLAFIRIFAVNVPFWNEWDLVPLVQRLRDATWTFTDFWAQQAGERIATIKLIMAPLI